MKSSAVMSTFVMSTTDRFLVLFIFNGHPKNNEVKSDFTLKLKLIWPFCYTKTIKNLLKKLQKKLLLDLLQPPTPFLCFPTKNYNICSHLSLSLSKKCHKKHCIRNMHKLISQTYVEAERTQQLTHFFVVHPYLCNFIQSLPLFAILFLWRIC